MPIDRVSLSDPFAHEEVSNNNSSAKSHDSKAKKSPTTISYSKMTVNSENDLAYIREGINQKKMQQIHDYTPFIDDTIEQTHQKDSIPKRTTIGSKTYFMPRMIIACEKLEPIISNKHNQSLPSEE